MGIVKAGKFGFDKIRKKYMNGNTPLNVSDEVLLRRLTDIGILLTNHARTITKSRAEGGYDDHTGNLRSSIGFRIYKDGEIKQEGGFQSVGGTLGVEAAKEGLNTYELAHSIPINGWTIVIVAGMSYAKYVEAKGYNVLHLTNIKMREEIEKLKGKL